MSILDAYRMFQEQQLAQGIDPSVAPRLTQQEQDAMRLAATSPEPTTASSQPSGDVSSTGMLTETREQSQARESVTDDTMSYEQRVNNLRDEFKAQYNVLEAKGFNYVNPSDLDYIIEEQAKEFAKAGVDSIYDLGKRNVKTGVTNVEVDKITDANGKVRYEYTTGGMVGFGGGRPKTIRVDPSTVKEVTRNMSGNFGNPQPVYIATLPDTMDELFNKKTGETVDVFAGGGTLRSGGEESTSFGNLYSGVEGGADLNVKFVGDQPIFYPLYQDTSDRDIITPAIVGLTIAAGGYANEIGTKILGEAAAGTVKATALGNALVTTGGSLALGRDLEDALLAATMAYGVTYGVDALQSGKFGDYLVDNNILEADTVESLNIPRGAVEDPTAYTSSYTKGAVEDTTALDYSLTEGTTIPSDALEKGILIDGKFTDAQLNAFNAESQFRSEFPYLVGESNVSFADPSFADILSGQGGANLASDLPILTSGEVGFIDALPNITDAASATKAVDDIIKAAGAGVVATGAVKKVVEEASKFIDLKEVFGDTAGGVLENIIGTGIDYAGLSALQKSLEERGEDIQKEYESVFRPYTVTTGFGTGTVAPEGATATVGADYQPLRTAQLDAARGMFEGLPGTREEATAQQLAATRALTEPQRQREQERMLGTLAQRGLLGYGQTMATVGGERRVNPLAESILSAQELAKSQEALAAQQFGLTEAGRQANLAQGLLTGAQTIDQQALAGLTTGRDISATLQQKPELAGLSSRSQYDQLVALSEIEKLRGLTSGAKGLFNLPTEQGNVTAKQIQQIIDLGELLKTRTATG